MSLRQALEDQLPSSQIPNPKARPSPKSPTRLRAPSSGLRLGVGGLECVGIWDLEVGIWPLSPSRRLQPLRQLRRLGGARRGAGCRSARATAAACARRRALCASLKNVLISAAVAASQNDASAPTMTVLPTNSPVFFWISAQRSRTSCQARSLGIAVGEHAARSRTSHPASGPRPRASGPSSAGPAPDRRRRSARTDTDSAPRDRSRPCSSRDSGRRARHRRR